MNREEKAHGFGRIAILGPGLLGGSLLLSLRRVLPGCHLRVWARRAEALEKARSLGLADFGSTDVGEAVESADLIILALPIQHMGDAVRRFPMFDREVVVTDVGSTKVSVVTELTGPVGERGGVFVGCHPMAGSEKTGIDHASDDLFAGAPVILTPGEKGRERDAAARLEEFWVSLGGKVSYLTPREHDRVIASISHLPHLVAAALVRNATRRSGEPSESFSALDLAGGGFRDSTRIAGGDPDMWAEILLANRDAVQHEVGRLIGELSDWRDSLASLDKDTLYRFLCEAREFRGKL